jgi:hypothetical protein
MARRLDKMPIASLNSPFLALVCLLQDRLHEECMSATIGGVLHIRRGIADHIRCRELPDLSLRVGGLDLLSVDQEAQLIQ